MRAIRPFFTKCFLLLLVGMPVAQATGIGGDCCAELEERIAELEATADLKGNRKMSLSISGQVNRIIMWWDDGRSSKAYYGLDFGTIIRVSGETKVTPDVKVGFFVELGSLGAGSIAVNQWDSDGKNSGIITPLGAQSFTGNNADPPLAGARYLALWIEDEKLGRVTLGHTNMAGAVTTVDLAGINTGAPASLTLISGSFLLRGPAGQYYAMSWNRIVDPASNRARMNEVRYTTPVIGGFVFVSSMAEDGADLGTMLLYANEVNGFRVAGGIGYEHYGQITAQANCFAVGSNPCANPPGYGPGDANFPPAPNVNAWGVGLAALHLSTGLFAQGHYIHVDYDENHTTTVAPNGFWGQFSQGRIPADQWLIQGGITKNWFGLGNTWLFGEYSRNSGWGASGGPFAPAGLTYSAVVTPGAQTVFGVSNTEATMYGFGVQQRFDAVGSNTFPGGFTVGTDVYLDARHFSADITCSATGENCTGAAAKIGSLPLQKLQTEGFWAVIGGMRVRF